MTTNKPFTPEHANRLMTDDTKLHQWNQSRKEADPNGLNQHQPGAKLDAGKPLTWLMLSGFANALQEVARVTTVGAEKYTPAGWLEVENGAERYMEAFARHALELGIGSTIDLNTGCLHKAQMIWNLLASLELDLREEADCAS